MLIIFLQEFHSAYYRIKIFKKHAHALSFDNSLIRVCSIPLENFMFPLKCVNRSEVRSRRYPHCSDAHETSLKSFEKLTHASVIAYLNHMRQTVRKNILENTFQENAMFNATFNLPIIPGRRLIVTFARSPSRHDRLYIASQTPYGPLEQLRGVIYPHHPLKQNRVPRSAA